MFEQPQKEHQWLQKLVGQWSYESECSMGPDAPPMKSTGAETVRSLGGMWTIGESQCTTPDGGVGTMIMTLGYDPKKKRFVGTFIGSMMTHLWLYDGKLDEANNVLTLDAEGPSMASEGAMAKYQDIMTFKSDDHRILTSMIQGPDGKWTLFMTAHYRKAK